MQQGAAAAREDETFGSNHHRASAFMTLSSKNQICVSSDSLEARWGWHGVTRVSSREGFVVSSRSSKSFDIFHGAAVLQSQALQALIVDILAKHSKFSSLSVWGFHWWKTDKQVGWRIYFIHRAVKTLWPHPQLETVKNSRSGFNLANWMCSTVQGDHAHRKAASGNWIPNLL